MPLSVYCLEDQSDSFVFALVMLDVIFGNVVGKFLLAIASTLYMIG
jgi:hypothetical protein